MQCADIFLDLNASPFIGLLYFFICLMVLVFTFIIFFSFYKRKSEKKEKRWQEIVSVIISEVVFFENVDNSKMEVKVDEKLLQNPAFRQYFINEIIHVKKNLFGAPVLNLKRLYEILEFDNDSLKKIHSKKWHIKAKGIQELAIMDQVQCVKEIFRLTNNSNELVRNEAQCALVNFYGFKGFRFLNIIKYPISQWQQIQLLNYLHDAKTTDSRQLKKWLGSKNESVITLSLKLAAFYNSFEVYNEVLQCLQNTNQQVKLTALKYLVKINDEDTPEHITNCYHSSERKVKLEILSLLEQIGTEMQETFLLKQLHNSDNKIKVAAAKTLSCIHPSGVAFLHSHLFADEDPWKSIFSQIEKERAA